MVRLYNSILLLSLLGTGLAVAAPQFDQEAELRKSECDVSLKMHRAFVLGW
jgi:hypothetical protein